MMWLLPFLFLAPLISSLGYSGSSESIELRIGFHELAPLVIDATGERVQGFEIDLFEEAAHRLGWHYTYESLAFVRVLEAVEQGEMDLGIAGITQTAEREERIDFSTTYLKSRLIVISQHDKSFNAGAVVLSLGPPLLYFLLFILFFGHIVWFAERGHDAFSDNYFPGIFESLYFVVVTGTTVGYGDYAPKRWVGRITVILMMICSILFFGWFLSAISSIDPHTQRDPIHGFQDLHGRIIATERGSNGAGILEKMPVKVELVESAQEGMEKLRRREVDGVLTDSVHARYLLRAGGHKDLVLSEELHYPQGYGIALSPGSELREPLNQALLGMVEDGTYARIYRRWFGRDPH